MIVDASLVIDAITDACPASSRGGGRVRLGSRQSGGDQCRGGRSFEHDAPAVLRPPGPRSGRISGGEVAVHELVRSRLAQIEALCRRSVSAASTSSDPPSRARSTPRPAMSTSSPSSSAVTGLTIFGTYFALKEAWRRFSAARWMSSAQRVSGIRTFVSGSCGRGSRSMARPRALPCRLGDHRGTLSGGQRGHSGGKAGDLDDCRDHRHHSSWCTGISRSSGHSVGRPRRGCDRAYVDHKRTTHAGAERHMPRGARPCG